MRRTTRHFAPALACSTAAVVALGGCLQRRLYITSDPPGAVVRLNDLDVGRTPVEVDFEWYGTYDVQLQLEGHEPLSTSQKADAPVHEWPGIDLITMALPFNFKDEVRWHFTLTPAASDPHETIQRAGTVRAMLPKPVEGEPEPPEGVTPSPELAPQEAPIESPSSDDDEAPPQR